MSNESEISERLARIETILEAHLPGMLQRLDTLSQIPTVCARNDERIKSLEAAHRNVKRGVIGIIVTAVGAAVTSVISFWR